MHKFFIFIVIGAFFLNSNIFLLAQEAAEKKEESSPKQEKEITWEESNADQPVSMLYSEYEIILNEDWSYDERIHYRLKIQKDSAKSLGEQSIYYNKSREEISNIQAYVKAADEKTYPFTDIQDLAVYQKAPMYSDFRVKVITLPQVTTGSIIDVEYTKKTSRNIIKNHFWGELFYPTSPSKYVKSKYIFPDNKSIRYKAYKADYGPVVEKKDGKTIYTFIFKETDDRKNRELYTPPFEELYGFSTFSSMDDWSVIADWYRELVNKNTTQDDLLQKTVKELTENKTTQKEKAQAILEFMQDNFRYVSMSFGDHTVEPHSSKEVFENRYGDCKDWATLIKQMLSLAGIKSHICLFSSEFDGNPQNSLPNVGMFNHVILEVIVDGKNFFIEPQAKGYELGKLPLAYDGAHLLVIEDDQYRFDKILPAGEDTNAMTGSGDVYINEDGSAVYDLRITFGLDMSQEIRQAWEAVTDLDKKQFYETFDAMLTKGGEMIERNWEGMDNRYGLLSIKLKFKNANAFPLMNDMLILNDNEDLEEVIPKFTDKERKSPIFMPNNFFTKGHIVYHVPEGFYIDYIPEDFSIAVDFMEMNRTHQKEADTITVDDIFRTKRSSMPAERYQEVKDFWNKLYKVHNQYPILKKKKEE